MANLPKKYVEEKAIDILNAEIKNPHISSMIKKKSTEESWDGHLIFYNNIGIKKDTLQIPAQVKGTTLNYDLNSFPVEVVDLENFRSNGIVYFVVKIEFDGYEPVNHRILASCLIGREINNILSKLRKNQKHVTLEFHEIKDTNGFINLCNAYKEKQKNVSMNDRLDKTKNTFSVSDVKLIGKDNVIHKFPRLGEEYFMIINENDKETYHENIKISQISGESNKGVSINGKIYFDKIKIEKSKDTTEYFFDDKTILTFKDGKERCRLSISPKSNLSELRNSFMFMKDLEFYKGFYIGNHFVPSGLLERQKEEDLKMLDYQIEEIDMLIAFCKQVGISEDFNYFLLKSNDIAKIYNLFVKQEENAITHYFIDTPVFCVSVIKIQVDGKRIFYNIFDPQLAEALEVKAENPRTKERAKFAPFYRLKLNEWKKVQIPDVDKLSYIIDKYIDFNENSFEIVNQLINTLLLAFDETNKDVLLEIAEYLNNKFREKRIEMTWCVIHYLEIKYRYKNEFTDIDREFLDKLLEQKDDLCSFTAYVLSKDKYHAKLYAEKIDSSWKKTSIYNLYKRL